MTSPALVTFDLEGLSTLHVKLREVRGKMREHVEALASLQLEENRIEKEIRAVMAGKPPNGRTGRPPRSSHPFPRAVNVSEWSRVNNVPIERVRTWYADGPRAAPIPKKYAKLIAEKYGITADAWPAGVI